MPPLEFLFKLGVLILSLRIEAKIGEGTFGLVYKGSI
jgi:hypothetical protein